MSNYFLEHYGVVGMKWGRRKATTALGAPVVELGSHEYRFKDGSSSSRNSSSSNSTKSNKGGGANPKQNTSSKKHKSQYADPEPTTTSSKKTKDLDVKGIQNGLKGGKKLVDAGAKKLEDDRKKETVKDLKSEAKNMSDDELRNVINRLNMEERYVQAMEKEGFGKSKTDLQKTLELVGTAVSYADTALDVYDKIQSIRGR